MQNHAIFGVRKNGRLYFYLNRCPHLGAEMEWTENEFLDETGNRIRCNIHGALFQVEDGLCLSGPCRGDALLALPTRELDGEIFWSPGHS